MNAMRWRRGGGDPQCEIEDGILGGGRREKEGMGKESMEGTGRRYSNPGRRRLSRPEAVAWERQHAKYHAIKARGGGGLGGGHDGDTW